MNKELFKKGLSEVGYNLSEKEENDFFAYSRLLVQWNEKMNLTAVTDDDGISIKHFLDSTVPIFKYEIKSNAKLIDIGTGAGFPGIPINILRRDLKITYLDSLNKRINFLKEVSNTINLENAEFIHGRAEDAGHSKIRGSFDYATSRAVAPLKILAEYALPLLKVGGEFLAYKSSDIDEEIADAKSMIGNLGGKIKEVIEIEIPFADFGRKLVIIEKIAETPKQFPRKPNKIKK